MTTDELKKKKQFNTRELMAGLLMLATSIMMLGLWYVLKYDVFSQGVIPMQSLLTSYTSFFIDILLGLMGLFLIFKKYLPVK